MHKRHLYHLLTGLRQLRTKQLALLFVVLLVLGIFFVRQNNVHMITLRNKALQADEQNQNIPQALTNLRNYITAHMNTGMGERGIYLEHSYQRAYEAVVTQAEQGTTAGSTIYRQADEQCQALYSKATVFQAYVQCLTDKVAASGAAAGLVQPPSSDLYRFNFVSPAWSPDVAGFTLLAATLVGGLLVGGWALRGIVYLLIRLNR
jgi:hypothetical protein